MEIPFHDLTYAKLVKLVTKDNFVQIIEEEHKKILSEKPSGTFEDSTNNINKRLNRYQNAVCYDHSRVMLPVEKNYGNYINANFVNGYEYDKKYICTQAPLLHTCYDYWRMAWMTHTNTIVMLCQKVEDKKEKCAAYWSDTEGYAVKFNKFTITTTKIEHYTSFIKTTLLLSDGTGARQEITHFQFTQWPDLDTPTDTEEFLNFILAVRQHHEETTKRLIDCDPTRLQQPPIIIHCSAGLGRTGTYCALDRAISKFNATGMISIASIALDIRRQRYHTLFILSQYFFCYRVMIHYTKLVASSNSKSSFVYQSLTLVKKLFYRENRDVSV